MIMILCNKAANYYLADNEKGYTFDVNECSIIQYRKMLLSAVKDVLEILGYDIERDLLAPTTTAIIHLSLAN